ncbi:hypothetical protein GJ744_003892 [Endocarpon pusillum]|uniref:Mid2 domain-containing protein n=1 Tax=Endocarpon pusillum TaxID=364733 RepID=A0A8H7DXX4_9EURO|nr:hypothetical protein GJ744_003892 [Endocarpon pusillum]
MRLHTFVALVACALSSVGMAQTCYYPDGKATGALIPCNTTAAVTNCCKDSDMCLKNGLCFSPGLNSVVRRGCTDQTWNNTEACPDVCLTAGLRSADVVLTPCGEYGTFCCGQNSGARACCDTGNGTVQVGTGEVIDSSISSPSPSPSSPSSSSSPSPTTAATGTNATVTAAVTISSNNGTVQANCKAPEMAAYALGALLGCALLLLAVLGTIWCLKRKEPRVPT